MWRNASVTRRPGTVQSSMAVAPANTLVVVARIVAGVVGTPSYARRAKAASRFSE